MRFKVLKLGYFNFYKMRIINFIREAIEEMRKVDWPDKQKVFKYTLSVIQLSIAVAIFLGLLDLLFSNIVGKYIL
jgi:preprotein translocase subunit SecE